MINTVSFKIHSYIPKYKKYGTYTYTKVLSCQIKLNKTKKQKQKNI
jgi:hypothetical protein